MTHKCFRRDPDVKAVTDLVTEEQMQSVFQAPTSVTPITGAYSPKAASRRLPPGTRATR